MRYALFMLALLVLPAPAEIAVLTVDGRTSADQVTLRDNSLELRAGEKVSAIALDDLIEIEWRARSATSRELELDLGSPSGIRDVVRGWISTASNGNTVVVYDDEGRFDVPVDRVLSVRRCAAGKGVQPPAAPPKEVALLRLQDGSDESATTEFFAKMVGLSFEGVRIRRPGTAEDELIGWARIDRVDLPNPAPAPVASPRLVFVETVGGSQLAGELLELRESTCRLKTLHLRGGDAWTPRIPLGAVASIHFHSDLLVPLTGLKPVLLKTWHLNVESPGQNPGPDERWMVIDRDIHGAGPVRVDGLESLRGISTNAHTEVEVRLDGKYRRFFARAGLSLPDDASEFAEPVLKFTVKADGKEVWSSGPLERGSRAVRVDLNVEDVKVLTLVSDDENLVNALSLGAWADPVLVLRR